MKITFVILFALMCMIADLAAFPQSYTIDRFDRAYRDFDDPHHIDDYRNSRLRRTYYTDDDLHRSGGGYYPSYQHYNSAPAPVPVRREDTNIDRALKFTPLVRYKSTRTKRKKLFVPNLWG
ncbi:uncharacterized protein LOC129906869 [Episyrphus balteatus]|uniref:uncharacterized protein LOC129906869 n=1 Tax=Episyrphus balteatus TaxID=286459 RepID=UPI002485A50E|nr:uncharacterized protein LOC129906869 [Episyrphus balteatus]